MARGLFSGLVATSAYTVSSALLRRWTSGEADRTTPSATDRPGSVAAELARGSDPNRRWSGVDTAVHWSYGTVCGLVRPALDHYGVHGWRADAAHLAVVWLPWRILLTARDLKRGSVAPDPHTLMRELVKHGVYTLVAGRVHALLGDSDSGRERR